ncbi:MAG: SH3 domain-containing protein [Pseudomonadota bacterium]
MGRLRTILAVAALATLGAPALAAEYRSVGDQPAVLYDAPSVKARPLFVASPGYPVEIIVNLENWSKVRDVAGDLAWIEKSAFGERRTVLVSAPLAQMREAPKADARIVFEAQQGVVLERLESTVPGWIRVRHRDGGEGFVAVAQVWGA